MASNPISLATSVRGVGKFCGEHRMSAGRVGLFCMSQENLQRSTSFLLCPCIVDGEAEEGLSFVEVEASFFSCFFPNPTPIDESYFKDKKNKKKEIKWKKDYEPKVRKLCRFWYLQTRWIMPDMHPMLLPRRVFGTIFS
jgi:hypothetical protein